MKNALRYTAVWATACAVSSVMAWAQLEGQPAIPAAEGQLGDPPAIWHYLLFALFALLTLGVSIFPSKRGHQD